MSVQKPSHKQYRISGHRILIKLRKKGKRQQQPTVNSSNNINNISNSYSSRLNAKWKANVRFPMCR